MAFEWQCPKCGREFNTTSGKCANWECNNADVYIPYVQVGPSQGWQCPLCRVVHAPWVPSCKCANAEPVTTTTATDWELESGTTKWKVVDDALIYEEKE